MKKKRSILVLFCAMIVSLCGFAGAMAAEPGSGSRTYVTGGGFSSSEVESTTQSRPYADAAGVQDALFLLNKPIGGDFGVSSEIIFDVEFMAETKQFKLGLSRTNDKAALADAVSNYVLYYPDTTTDPPGQQVAAMVNGKWNHGAATEIASLNGEVSLKLEISAFGNAVLSVRIPASNTEMDESLARDTWLDLYRNEDVSWPFLSFASVEHESALKETGYPFFSASYFRLLGASIASVPPESVFDNFTEDFSDPSSFDANWITNDAFDAGLEDGTASKPNLGAVSFVESAPNDKGIYSTASSGVEVSEQNMIASTAVFSGALRAEVVVDSTGPSVIVGFLSGETNAPVNYFAMNLNGYSAIKNGVQIAAKIDSRWDQILGETSDKFFVGDNGEHVFGGEMKVILEVSADGTAKVSLRVIRQTTGSGLKTDADYPIATVEGLFSDAAAGGGRFFIGCPNSIWNHTTSVLSAEISTSAGSVFSDDFSGNNFNGNGLGLWTTSASTTLALPPLSEVTFSGEGTLGVKTAFGKLETLGADIVSGSFNFRLTSGVFGAAFGLDEGYVYGEGSSYLYFRQDTDGAVVGFRKGTAAGDERALTGLDLTSPTLVGLRLIGATGALEVQVGGRTEVFTLDETEGFFGFFGEGSNIAASLNYLSLRSNPASAPVITLPEITEGFAGQTYDLMPVLSDANFSLQEILEDGSFDYSVEKDGTPFEVADLTTFRPTEAGTYVFSFTAENPAGQTAEQEFVFTVTFGDPSITLGNTADWYNGLEEIIFEPEVSDPYDPVSDLEITMEVYAGQEAEGTPLAADGLAFTPTETGFYTVKFTVRNTHDRTASVQKTFRVIDLPQMADASADFGSSEKFETIAGTPGEGTLVLGANGLFGTAGWARNYVQMVRILSISEDCSDIVLYFGRLNPEDPLSAACTVTLTRGSTKAAVRDESGERSVELGVDVFAAIGDGSLVVQATMMGGTLDLAFMYGDLPYDSLNEPVASISVTCTIPGCVGIATASGGVTIDRFVFVNLSDYSEIPDDVVPPDPEEPQNPDDGKDEEPEKGGCGGCGSVGGTGGIGGMLGGGLLILAAAVFGGLRMRKGSDR